MKTLNNVITCQPLKMETPMKKWMNIFTAILLVLMFAGQAVAQTRTTTYLHADGLGSVVAATDEAGDVIWRKHYAPYGNLLEGSNETEKVSYTGHSHDADTGLTYMKARYYDPDAGRFMGMDPVGVLGSVESDPMMFNRYAYAGNNPYKFVDPDGRAKAKPGGRGKVPKVPGQLSSGASQSLAGILSARKNSTLSAEGARIGKHSQQTASYVSNAHSRAFDNLKKLFSERVRHFTNSKGMSGIMGSNTIKASDQNSVFTVKAKGNPGSARDVEKQLGIGRGRGNNYVDFDARPGEFRVIKNSTTGATERVFKGDVDLSARNATFKKNK